MDIPAYILDELKCSSCKVFLSQGPVYLQRDGATVCGRCYTPKRPAIHNKQYEATAKLLKFPCKYQNLGCPETVLFVGVEEVIPHEEACEHRQYVCPVLGPDRCDWLGSTSFFLAHCRAQHADRVLYNPCILTHHIAKSSLQNYIVTAFHRLFLLQMKVCVTSSKISYSVQLLGDSAEAADFIYNIHIKRNNEQMWKEWQVQEDSSVSVDINSYLNMLDGFDDTTITVTVTVKWRVMNSVYQLATFMEEWGNMFDVWGGADGVIVPQ